MYAIIATGGKQYKVAEGDVIRVEKLGAEAGETVTFDQVLAVSNDGLKVGEDVANATVTASVVENGKATGKFINADNIDGTKRTLKHNAYVYKTSKKRANKVVLKKGKEVTTYGGTYTFKNGKQYYKINNNTEKTYVKASNF